MAENIQEIVDVLGECRRMMPGGCNAADAVAVDYLIRRLQGELVKESLMVFVGDISPPAMDFTPREFRHNYKPVSDDIWW